MAFLLLAGGVVAYSPRWAAPGVFRVSLGVLRRAGTQDWAVRRVAGCPSRWEPGPGGGRGRARCHPVSMYDSLSAGSTGAGAVPGGQPDRVRVLSVPPGTGGRREFTGNTPVFSRQYGKAHRRYIAFAKLACDPPR